VICEVLDAIAQAPEGTLLFHCAAGKDRTGIIAALVLSIAGVGRETILDDYELTAAQIEPFLPDFEKRAIERDLLGCSFWFARKFLKGLVGAPGLEPGTR